MVITERSLARWTAAAIVLLGVCFVVLLARFHSDQLVAQGAHRDGTLLVGNNDGYYFLEQARTLIESGSGLGDLLIDDRSSMLLPYSLSTVSGSNPERLERIAPYVVPVLSLFMLLAVIPWGMELRNPWVMAGAAGLSLLAPYWLVRTHAGVLDTDVLVPGLCFYALYSLYRFSTSSICRWRWAVLYGFLVALSWYWWRPGALLSLGFMVCYLVYPSHLNEDRVFKGIMFLLVLSLLGLAWAGVQPFAQFAAYVVSHAKLAFGGVNDSLLSDSIIELGGVGPVGLGQKSLGSAWLLAPALGGAVVYAVRERMKSVFLLSAWVFGGAAMLSQRFIPLFVPVAALFASYGMVECARWVGSVVTARMNWKKSYANIVLSLGCMPLLLGGVVLDVASYEPKSYFTKNDVVIAETVRTGFPADTVVWTWWDYGYFFRYYTKMDTFFDGGSQRDLTCFTAAYPLMVNDMATAAKWMKHFSTYSPSHLEVGKAGKLWQRYVDSFVTTTISQLSPRRPVALALPARVYTTSGYLYSFAHVFDEVVPPVTNHLELFPKQGFRYDPQLNEVVVPQVIVDKGYDSFGSVLNATGHESENVDFSILPDPYLVYSEGTDFLAVSDRDVVGSVLFRLLGLFKGDTECFDPIMFDYRIGGVWRVL